MELFEWLSIIVGAVTATGVIFGGLGYFLQKVSYKAGLDRQKRHYSVEIASDYYKIMRGMTLVSNILINGKAQKVFAQDYYNRIGMMTLFTRTEFYKFFKQEAKDFIEGFEKDMSDPKLLLSNFLLGYGYRDDWMTIKCKIDAHETIDVKEQAIIDHLILEVSDTRTEVLNLIDSVCMRINLDLAYSKLLFKFIGTSFLAFIDLMVPYICNVNRDSSDCLYSSIINTYNSWRTISDKQSENKRRETQDIDGLLDD